MELVYNQRYLADPGHRVSGSVGQERKEMSSTPLSDTITRLTKSGPSERLKETFYRRFLKAELGVVFHGMPKQAPGTSYTVGEGDNVTCTTVNDANGHVMIKACADPVAFEQEYSEGINAHIGGQALLEMLMKLPDIEGVLVCSAASFHSVPIYREEAERLLVDDQKVAEPRKSWWHFWG